MISLEDISWGQITHWRQECRERFGEIHQLPVISFQSHIRSLLSPTIAILDIGAGIEKPLLKMVKEQDQLYFSLDVDPLGTFDFRDFSEIPAQQLFDLAFANQVLEHVAIPEALHIAQSTFAQLRIGGMLVATVPNAAHPVRQWGDATHITAWPLGDLYGLFRLAGFRVITLARYNKYRLSRNPIKRYIIRTVASAYRIDWCDSLLISGQKPSDS